MKRPLFSILIHTERTNALYFRDALESLLMQDYDRFEILVLDNNPTAEVARILRETFSLDRQPVYKQLKKNEGRAYALNVGLHFARGDYFLIMGQHDRLSSDTLRKYAEVIEEGKKRIRRFPDGTMKEISEDPEVIYCDQDEMMGEVRANPHFKGGFNRWLLLQDNYIGEFICFSRAMTRRVGTFAEGIHHADIYEYLLRASEKDAVFLHVPLLLFHRRMLEVQDMSVMKKMLKESYAVHVEVAKAFQKRVGITADLIPDPQYRYWKMRLKGGDPEKNKKDYMLLKSKQVRIYTGQSKKMLYAYLSQPDVGVAGVCFRGAGMNVDNCGYIFDTNGITYPACYGKSLFSDGYENRIVLTQEVSMVDFSYCMIDANVYKHLRGFRSDLAGRDAILDFCLRVQQSGYKVLYVADIVARNLDKSIISTEASNAALREKWGELLRLGDPYYNLNLPMGLENYQLY